MLNGLVNAATGGPETRVMPTRRLKRVHCDNATTILYSSQLVPNLALLSIAQEAIAGAHDSVNQGFCSIEINLVMGVGRRNSTYVGSLRYRQ